VLVCLLLDLDKLRVQLLANTPLLAELSHHLLGLLELVIRQHRASLASRYDA